MKQLLRLFIAGLSLLELKRNKNCTIVGYEDMRRFVEEELGV